MLFEFVCWVKRFLQWCPKVKIGFKCDWLINGFTVVSPGQNAAPLNLWFSEFSMELSMLIQASIHSINKQDKWFAFFIDSNGLDLKTLLDKVFNSGDELKRKYLLFHLNKPFYEATAKKKKKISGSSKIKNSICKQHHWRQCQNLWTINFQKRTHTSGGKHKRIRKTSIISQLF